MIQRLFSVVVVFASLSLLLSGSSGALQEKDSKKSSSKKSTKKKSTSKSKKAKKAKGKHVPPKAYANRLKKKSALRREGGSRRTEDAIRHALRWLVKHQHPDGSWRAAGFLDRCKKKCSNKESSYRDGKGWPEADLGVTGLAVLAFTGFGETHLRGTRSEFQKCLKRAVKYLVGQVIKSDDPTVDGMFRLHGDGEHQIYGHAIATTALLELLALSGDEALRDPVTRSTRFVLRAQNPGWGWRYGYQPADNDTSVSGWMALTVKAAHLASLKIPKEELEKSWTSAMTWFDRATLEASGKVGYLIPGDEGSMITSLADGTGRYGFSKKHSTMTAVAAFCRMVGGTSREDEMLRKGLGIVAAHPPRWEEPSGGPSLVNYYYWYYGTNAMFQLGGDYWKHWNERLQPILLEKQRRRGDENGSWDTAGEWTTAGGRVYATAINALTLEVYYRFPRVPDGESLEY